MARAGDGALQRLVQRRDARPKRVNPDGTPTKDFHGPGSKRDERVRIIKRYVAGGTVTFADRDLSDAMFLHHNSGWKPEDLGYPPRDYILIDLMRQFG